MEPEGQKGATLPQTLVSPLTHGGHGATRYTETAERSSDDPARDPTRDDPAAAVRLHSYAVVKGSRPQQFSF